MLPQPLLSLGLDFLGKGASTQQAYVCVYTPWAKRCRRRCCCCCCERQQLRVRRIKIRPAEYLFTFRLSWPRRISRPIGNPLGRKMRQCVCVCGGGAHISVLTSSREGGSVLVCVTHATHIAQCVRLRRRECLIASITPGCRRRRRRRKLQKLLTRMPQQLLLWELFFPILALCPHISFLRARVAKM